MSHASEYVIKQAQECRESWFKDHRATAVSPLTAEQFEAVWAEALVIRFVNPKSWNYGCHFIIHRRWLTVVGDIGEATYEWSGDLTLNFLAGLDFGYFHSKCVASEVGKRFNDWDDKIAKAYVKDRIADIKATDLEDRCRDDATELEILEDLGDDGKEEYDKAGHDYYDATGDGEGASGIAQYGEVPSGRCIGHFEALKLAIAQLRSATPTP